MRPAISPDILDPDARAVAMSNLDPKRVVVIFAEPLLAPSMTFIGAQASALTEFTALYVSPQRASPSLPFLPNRAVVLCDNPEAPQVWNRLKQVPFKVFGYAPLFFRRVERHGPVLVHAHCAPAGLTALPLARWLKVPLVVTVHGYDATVSDAALIRSHYRARVYVRKRQVLHKETALYIAVSEFLRKQMIARGFPEERIVVHYTGVDTQFFDPDQHTREPVVLFTGRLTEKKGCAHLIRAMHEVEAVTPETKLVVIGDGELREELENLASQKLRNCSFLGVQSPSVVRKWMNRASVFSVPSVRASSGDREGLGMAFLEAQAMGLPVAGFRSGGVPEAVEDGETGLLAEEGDWRTLAGNILTLLEDRNRWRAMSEAGRRRVRASFDLVTQTAKLERMYGRVLEDAACEGKVKSRLPAATSTGTPSAFPLLPKQLPTAPRRRFAFVQPFCTHYTAGLFARLAERLDAQYLFYSDGGEWYWQAEHGVRSGDFPHEYLGGFRLGRTRIAPALPWKLWRSPARAILSSIDGKFALPAAYLMARWKGVPFLLWTGLWFRLGTPLHRWTFGLTRFIYRHADAIVVYGEHVKSYLVSEGVRPERIFVAPHAVDNAFYSRFVSDSEKDALRRKLGIHAGQNVILYLGRLEAVKGIPHLLEAFAASRLEDSVLVVAGAGRERPALERLVASLRIAERVRFAGYVPTDETVGYYGIASVVVLPSVTTPQAKELWGLVVNEAFNQGVPVIATDAVGAAAGGLVRDGVNGVVVPEGNAAALARALESVVNDPSARRQMGAAARRVVAEWNQDAQATGFVHALAFVLRAKVES